LRIVIAGQNETAEDHANFLYRALVRMKHIPYIYDYRRKGVSGLKDICAFHDAQLLLVLKGEIVRPDKLKSIECPRVLWCPDDPARSFIALQHFNNKPWGSYYDLVATHSYKALNMYKEAGLNASFIPFSYDPLFHYPNWNVAKNDTYTYDISFLGSTGDVVINDKKYYSRLEALNRIHAVYPNKLMVGHAWLDNASTFVSQCKINLNIPYSDQINVRHFWLCACGGFQLCRYTSEAEKYFGKNIVFWKDIPECLELIQYYLDNDKERKKIAKKGYNFVKKKGDYTQRLKAIFKLLKL